MDSVLGGFVKRGRKNNLAGRRLGLLYDSVKCEYCDQQCAFLPVMRAHWPRQRQRLKPGGVSGSAQPGWRRAQKQPAVQTSLWGPLCPFLEFPASVTVLSPNPTLSVPGISRCCRSGFRWRGFPASWCGIRPPPATRPAPPAARRSWTRRPPTEERGRRMKHSVFPSLWFFIHHLSATTEGWIAGHCKQRAKYVFFHLLFVLGSFFKGALQDEKHEIKHS